MQPEQHHTNDPLQDSQALLRAMIENLPGGAAFVVDCDLRYRLAEGEALAAAGFKPADFVGRTIFEVLPPDLAASYEVHYRKALAGEPFEHEHSSHNRFYISRGTPLRSANGEVYGVMVVSHDITERKRAETAAAADLEDTQRLRELSARLVGEDDIQTLYQEIMATAIILTRADAGTVQIVDEATQTLVLLATQGITPEMLQHFYRVNARSKTPCGIALAMGKRTFVDFDVPHSEDPDGSMRLHVEAGLLSAQSTPLISRSGKAIGMVSTHWRKHHRPSERELRFLDLLARQAADLIEQRQAEVALRESEALLAGQSEAFRAAVNGAALDESLEALIRATVAHFGDARCAFYVVKPNGAELRLVAGMSENYAVCVDGFKIGADSLACGLAAHLGEPVITPDVTLEPRWQPWLWLAKQYDYRAVWSFPVKTSAGKGVGTFALYFQNPREATVSDQVFASTLAQAAAIIISRHQEAEERQRAEAALRESEERFRAFVTASSDMVYRMSADWLEMRNLEGKKILTNTEAPSQTWIETYIPTAEQSRVWAAIEAAIRTKTTFELEHQVIRQDGTTGWVFSRAIPMLDEQGDIVEWFGAGSDITARKQAEAALHESEAKYRSLFTSMDEGYFLCDVIFDENNRPVDLFYIDENPAAIRMTGQSFRGQRLREISPNYEEYWYEIFGRVAQTGQGERLERYAEPNQIWYDFYVFKVGSDDQGRVAVVFNDITDRKQRELNTAFLDEIGKALSVLSTPDEIIQTVGVRLGKFLQASGCIFADVDEAKNEATIHHGWNTADVSSLKQTFRLADYFGEEFLRAGRAGEVVIVCDTGHDERANAEAYAQLQIGSFVTVPFQRDGRWTANITVTTREPRDWRVDEIELVQEIVNRIFPRIERARAEAAVRESELQRVREQSAREQERQRAETLAELDRAKTLFFSNVSHEFRTPLTLLLAPLQDVLSDSTHPLEPVHRERLELVHRNSLRLLKLVNTLLDFSRIEAGRMEAVYEPTDLAMFTTELASVFRSAIEQAGLRFIVDCPPLPAPVYVDRQMWEKIVLNLLSNAFKFTLEGEITVRLHPADAGYVSLHVQDTGTGIEPEELPHVFERFYQVRRAQARTYEGSGIGLALVHELIRLHGGTIAVSSTVGVGSCFTVTLPLGTTHLPNDRIQATRTLGSTDAGVTPDVQEAQRWLFTEGRNVKFSGLSSELEENASTQNSNLNPQNSFVLVVDDNADMRAYLKRILSEHVQVEAVADGASALAAVQAQVPALVLSDVMMPALDGLALLQALRADPRTQQIPIILLSARAGEEAVVEGLAAGADDYLIKPFSAQELVSRVNAHLQMAQLRSEALDQERSINRRKDELLSTVSHELNTPLVAILGWTRLLRANPSNQTMLIKALEIIERNATLQAKLVQDLLDLSRMTAGKLYLKLEPVALESVIETAIISVSQMAEAKEINLVWLGVTGEELDTLNLANVEPVFVMGDRERLQQIITNLLTNAIKFTPEFGTIQVKLLVIESQNFENSTVEISITDTGIGIAAEFLPYVFDRFRQANEADSAKGLGLGLAIARHLVELQGGTIHATSAGVGQGATFIVKLPILKEF